MAKDPSFLFYPGDFLTGCMFMTDEEIGKYIRLLCAQHQHGGLINKVAFNAIVKDSVLLREKFIETEDGFFNKRLMSEMEKRAVKASNLSANAKQRWEKEKQKQCNSNAIASEKHMPIENENRNEELINRGNGKGDSSVVKYGQFFPSKLIGNGFKEHWQKWIEHNEQRKTPITPIQAKEQLKYLAGLEKPIEQIELCIKNNWKGLEYNVTKRNTQRSKNFVSSDEVRDDLEKAFSKSRVVT